MSLKKSRTIRALINREIERQADKHADNLSYLKSIVLGMTKTFNIRYIYMYIYINIYSGKRQNMALKIN